MNSFLKWTFRALILIGILAVLFFGIGYYILTRSIPDYDAKDPIAHKDYQVEILRDLQAVPHIYGQTEKDALFALGYVHAQDRLWQMDSMRRTVQGRLSEIVGKQTLEIDKFFRALDMWNLADRAGRTLPEDARSSLQAYADGVNAYIADINENKRGSGAPEFLIFGRSIAPWTPTDSLALQKLMAYELSGSAEDEILRAKMANILSAQQMRDIFYNIKLPANFDRLEYASSHFPTRPLSPLAQALNPAKGVGNYGASNAFAVAPARAAGRSAILANDPHLQLSAPTLWMLAHLHDASTNNDIYGGTIPGIPLIIIGRNQNVAWGLTTAYLDDQDLIILDRQGNGFTENNQITPLQSEELMIEIKDQDEPYKFIREVSPYGPIIPAGGPWKVESISGENQSVALSWTALREDDHSILAGLKLMKAKNVNDAINALGDFIAPAQIFSLADKQGNIAQIAAGAIPVRNEQNPSRGIMPGPSWLGPVGFEGYVDPSQTPRLINPEDGLLIHTNNKFIEQEYPYHYTYDWGDVYRRLRAEELLGTRKYHTPASMEEAQNDEISEAARVILPLIARDFWFKPDNDEQKVQILEMLANWNGEFDALRPEPLIFAAWLEELNHMVFSDEIGPELYKELGRVDPLRIERVFRNVDGSAGWCDIRPTPEIEICSDISEMALNIAIKKLNAKFGSNFEQWRWGRAHHAVHKNRFLSNIPVIGGLTNIIQEQSGDTQTLLRLAYAGGEDYNFDSTHGAGLRMMVDFAHLDSSKIIIATGQSGHILSSHYDDLSTLWRAGEYISMNTNRQVIEGNLIGRIVFDPNALSEEN